MPVSERMGKTKHDTFKQWNTWVGCLSTNGIVYLKFVYFIICKFYLKNKRTVNRREVVGEMVLLLKLLCTI